MDPEAELKQAASCWTLNDLAGCFAHLNAYRKWRLSEGSYSPDFELPGWGNPKRPTIHDGDTFYRELLLMLLAKMVDDWNE